MNAVTKQTQPAHTPGPWLIGDGVGYGTVHAADGKPICRMGGNVTRDHDTHANAALIAAAPETAAERDALKASNAELLEALQDAERTLAVIAPSNHYRDGSVRPGPSDQLMRIRAAISKATGGAL